MKNLTFNSTLFLTLAILLSLGLSGYIFPENTSLHTEHLKRDKKKTQAMPIYGNWKTFTTKDGLPSDKIYCVRVDEDRIWAGTDKGLSLFENGTWRTYTQEDGLAHRAVLSLDVSPITGDLWVATMSGLNRFSGGTFETFTQFNSGLANDVIYAVNCDGKDVWVATGGGAGVLDTYTGKWGIYTEQNAPMHEPWTYSICSGGDKVFIAAWGGGVIEWNKKTQRFRDYTDPDGEMEIDLFPDDGIVHDITTAVSYENDILWVATYFGMSKYDGTHWKGYFDHDSGLASNFINFIKANANIAWICTDDGLSSFNSETWVTYKNQGSPKAGLVITHKGEKEISKSKATSSIGHNFTLGVDFSDDEIWVATSKGLTKGEVIGYVDEPNTKL